MTATLTPGEVVERTGLSLDTLRYYEKEQLLGPVARAAGGHRRYSEDDVFWVGLLSCLRAAGLGIADLREFTSLLRGTASSGDRVAFLVAHRNELQRRMSQLERAIGVLDEKIAHYGAAG